MQKLLPVIANVATAVKTDMGSAAELVLGIMKQFGKEIGDAGEVADLVTNAFSNSALNAERLGVAMQFAGFTGGAFGQKMSTVTAALAILKDAGLDASIAGTALRAIMVGLSKQTEEGHNVLQRYGLTMQDVTLETHSLDEALMTLQAAGVKTTDLMILFGKRFGAAAAKLLTFERDGRKGVEVMRDMDRIMAQTGSTAKNASIIQSGFGFAIRQTAAAFDLVKVNVGEALVKLFDLEAIATTISERFMVLTNIVKSLNFDVLKEAGARIFDPAELKQNIVTVFNDVLPKVIAFMGTAGAVLAGKALDFLSANFADIAKI